MAAKLQLAALRSEGLKATARLHQPAPASSQAAVSNLRKALATAQRAVDAATFCQELLAIADRLVQAGV